jgi:hypothetical protein
MVVLIGAVRKTRAGLGLLAFLQKAERWTRVPMSTRPTPDGAVFVVGGGVFAIGLIGEDGMVGDGVGAGAGDLSEKEALKAADGFQFPLLLVVDVEEIELTGAIVKLFGDAAEQAAHHGGAKGIEEEENGWGLRKRDVDGVAAANSRGRLNAAGCAPVLEIAAGDARQRWMEFDAGHLAEGHLGGEQDGAAHARADVDEGEVADGGDGFGAPPALDEAMEDRRRYAVVGGGMAVVAMAGFEMATGDEAAGADAIRYVEGMAGEAFGHGEARQESAWDWGGHDCEGSIRAQGRFGAMRGL